MCRFYCTRPRGQCNLQVARKRDKKSRNLFTQKTYVQFETASDSGLNPAHNVGKFGVVQGPSSDHSGHSSTLKLNFSVIVTLACAADMETEVLVCGTWHVDHQNVVFLLLWGMLMYVVTRCFFRILVHLAQQTMQRLLPVEAGERLGCCPTLCK